MKIQKKTCFVGSQKESGARGMDTMYLLPKLMLLIGKKTEKFQYMFSNCQIPSPMLINSTDNFI